jgi:hypothetical protein
MSLITRHFPYDPDERVVVMIVRDGGGTSGYPILMSCAIREMKSARSVIQRLRHRNLARHNIYRFTAFIISAG